MLSPLQGVNALALGVSLIEVGSGVSLRCNVNDEDFLLFDKAKIEARLALAVVLPAPPFQFSNEIMVIAATFFDKRINF